jgi:hypothetical protein
MGKLLEIKEILLETEVILGPGPRILILGHGPRYNLI